MRVGPDSMDGVLKRRREQKEMQKQEGHVKPEAEIGVVLLWAREHQKLPDVGREGKNKILLWSLRREPGPANTLISSVPRKCKGGSQRRALNFTLRNRKALLSWGFWDPHPTSCLLHQTSSSTMLVLHPQIPQVTWGEVG